MLILAIIFLVIAVYLLAFSEGSPANRLIIVIFVLLGGALLLL